MVHKEPRVKLCLASPSHLRNLYVPAPQTNTTTITAISLPLPSSQQLERPPFTLCARNGATTLRNTPWHKVYDDEEEARGERKLKVTPLPSSLSCLPLFPSAVLDNFARLIQSTQPPSYVGDRSPQGLQSSPWGSVETPCYLICLFDEETEVSPLRGRAKRKHGASLWVNKGGGVKQGGFLKLRSWFWLFSFFFPFFLFLLLFRKIGKGKRKGRIFRRSVGSSFFLWQIEDKFGIKIKREILVPIPPPHFDNF